MAAYSFKPRFIDPLLAGIKGGTIRADRKDGYLPAPGTLLQLYTGMRTQKCALIMNSACREVWPVVLLWQRNPKIFVAGAPLKVKDFDRFARFDGFSDFADMRDFWRETHDVAHFPGNWIKFFQPSRRLAMGGTVDREGDSA